MATLLQTDQRGRLEYLNKRISQLGFKFPVARLAKDMQLTKGHVSKVLAGKSDVSDEFLERFDEVYSGSSSSSDATFMQPSTPLHIDKNLELGAIKVTVADYINLLQKHNNYLEEIINLRTMQTLQTELTEIMRTIRVDNAELKKGIQAILNQQDKQPKV